MKAKLKRVMPIVLVVIFFALALIAEPLPISFAGTPYLPEPSEFVPNLGPEVGVTKNDDGTFLVTGLLLGGIGSLISVRKHLKV